jgi:hypothetical protein
VGTLRMNDEVVRSVTGSELFGNRMDAPDGPICACGKPSAFENGGCEDRHGLVWCDCASVKESEEK